MDIQVIGAGSWGLALTRLLANNGHTVRLWCREEDGPDLLQNERRSPHFLAHMRLPSSVRVDREIGPTPELVLYAVPSHAMRPVAAQWTFDPSVIRVSVAKGIENDSLLRMSEVLREVQGPCPLAVLSGPSHAEEVSLDKPASLVAASDHPDVAATVQAVFMADRFRVYTSGDLAGVELGGSVKNVIAIAAGICDGFELGDNAKAALITRGLAEMARLGIALGADPLTFAGLSGMGDLIVTCESQHSRNRAVGEQIARGRRLDDILESPMVAEGVRTTRSVCALATRLGIDMPISAQVHRILFEGADPKDSVATLMQRDAKPERG